MAQTTRVFRFLTKNPKVAVRPKSTSSPSTRPCAPRMRVVAEVFPKSGENSQSGCAPTKKDDVALADAIGRAGRESVSLSLQNSRDVGSGQAKRLLELSP